MELGAPRAIPWSRDDLARLTATPGHLSPWSDQTPHLVGDVADIRAQAVDLPLDHALGLADIALKLALLTLQGALLTRKRPGAPALEPIELTPDAVQVRIGARGLSHLVAHRRGGTELDQQGSLG